MAPHLSTELLECIFYHVAPSFSMQLAPISTVIDPIDTFLEEFYEDRDYKEQRHQLAMLSRVSKRFNEIVRPLLYHQLRLFDNDTCLFVRTLGSNVLLRGLVNSLSLETGVSEKGVRPDVWDAHEWSFWDGYKLCLDALGTDVAIEELQRGDPSLVVSRPLEPSYWNGDIESWGHPEDVAAILLYWLSGLKRLSIAMAPESDASGVPEWWRCKALLEAMRAPMHVGAMVNRQEVLQDATPEDPAHLLPAALLNLPELVMSNPHLKPFTVKAFYPPMAYCTLTELEPCWTFPALRKLTLCRLTVDEDVNPASKSSVQELALLDCCATVEGLPKLLTFFPLLRSLSYSMTDPAMALDQYRGLDMDMDPFFTRGILNVIHDHCPLLESLEMFSMVCHPFDRVIRGLTEAFEYLDIPHDEGRHLDGEELDPVKARSWLSEMIGTADLRQFTGLARLSCHMVDLVGWTPKWSLGQSITTRVAHILPPSLRQLKLRYDDLFDSKGSGLGDSTFEHLKNLIQDCGQVHPESKDETMLPQLESIILNVTDKWRHAEETLRSLREAALSKRIRLLWEWHVEMVEVEE